MHRKSVLVDWGRTSRVVHKVFQKYLVCSYKIFLLLVGIELLTFRAVDYKSTDMIQAHHVQN